MQPYVKMWYDAFAEGKIMGVKCDQCGGYEFPPVPVCSACAGTDMTWTEMSGRGTLVSFKTSVGLEDKGSDWPHSNGMVALEEGPMYGGRIIGIGVENFEEMYDKLPLAVRADIQDRGDYKFLEFRLAE